MRYEHILAAFHSSPWAILPEKLEEIRAFLRLKAAGGEIAEEDLQQIAAGRRPDGVQMYGRVAVVPVFGVISQRVGMLERASGGVGTEQLGATLDGLVADKTVRAIVMAFDSPGGSVFGVEELASKIRGARMEKKIVAIADSVAASAAYWLAAQASELNVTPGGQVGSIGVVVAHTDVSKAEEMMGVKTSVITSSPYKAEFSDTAPLGEEARAELQGKVNHYHAAFVGAVAKGRGVSEGVVSKDFGQGRMVTAKEAVSRGMSDHVATLEQVLRRLGVADGGGGMGAEAAAAPGLQARLAGYRARAVEVG